MSEKTIIYGGYGAIGSAIARKLRNSGADLHLVGRDQERLSTIADELGASYTTGDVCDTTLYPKVAEDTRGEVNGLVYAVGTINLGGVRRLDADDFIHDFQVNALGAALAVQSALSSLKKSKTVASVVLFSSVAATQGFTFHASMGMAKGAVNGLTLSLAAELAPKIRVNAIAPSLTRTPLADKVLPNEQVADSLAKMHALERLGTAADTANLAAFLLSADAGWITGQVIGVDGGRSSLRVKS